MSTISSKILTKLNTTDFNVGILSDDSESRSLLLKIDLADIDVLIANLQEMRTYVEGIKEHKQEQARRLLKELVESSGDFSSVDEVLALLAGQSPTASVVVPPKEKSASKSNSNTTYEIVLFDDVEDKHISFNAINKILPKKLLEHPLYQRIIKKNKSLEDKDLFLRAYSTRYAKDFPINAKWGKNEFYINEKGP